MPKYFGQNYFISLFTKPCTVIFRKVPKKQSENIFYSIRGDCRFTLLVLLFALEILKKL